MKKPKLDEIEKELRKGRNFSLTDEQYLAKTGAQFPQRKSYAQRNSAVAKKAREYGFRVVVIPKIIKFERNKKQLANIS